MRILSSVEMSSSIHGHSVRTLCEGAGMVRCTKEGRIGESEPLLPAEENVYVLEPSCESARETVHVGSMGSSNE